MSSEATDVPITSEPNTIALVCAESSEVLSVNLYLNLAEVTRLFKFSVNVGQNEIRIDELPGTVDKESLRVEGRGPATIHDVTITSTPAGSSKLKELQSRKTQLQKALNRSKKAIASLEKYMDNLNAQHVSSGQLNEVMDNYDATAKRLDDQLLEREALVEAINKEIAAERRKLGGKSPDENGKHVSVRMFATEVAEVELVLKYAVSNATWKAGYELRVNTKEVDAPVALVYKAAVSQNTREAWNNIHLTLNSTSPTYGAEIPSLQPWTLSTRKPTPAALSFPPGMTHALVSPREVASDTTTGPTWRPPESWFVEAGDEDHESESDTEPVRPKRRSAMPRTKAVASPRNNLGMDATFEVPGKVSIPSDGSERTFTLAELKLNATMTWVSVPKIDPTKVSLKAKIANASEYTLLPGQASVYIDGGFIFKSEIPYVSPAETFECSLGLDPSIRITYHPLSKRASTSGFSFSATRTINSVYIQRLTVHNTKSVAIPLLKIIDQIPVSEDERITVKLTNPALKISSVSSASGSEPGLASSAVDVSGAATSSRVGISSSGLGTAPETRESKSRGVKRLSLMSLRSSSLAKGLASPLAQVTPAASDSVRVSDNVVAQWNGADEPEVDVDGLGKDGMINWLCAIPAQAKVNLTLQWEVSTPSKTRVVGL